MRPPSAPLPPARVRDVFQFFDDSRPASGFTRREWLRVGSLGAAGATLPQLMESRPQAAASGKAKSCIVLFLLGAPPQQETWDPKPDSPVEYRGDLSTIPTSIPGFRCGELMPKTAAWADKLAILRAVRTGDNAHSTSGYYMCTGVPHIPQQLENAAPGFPNDHPTLGGILRKLRPSIGAIPSAITLPETAANDGGKTWPGQDAGFLGRECDPWVLAGDPSAKNFEVADLALPMGVAGERFDGRHQLLKELDRRVAHAERGGSLERFNAWQRQAFDLVRSPQARKAFDLSQETPATRERYGMNRFGQSVLLSRRLVEAGVPLVQVNWTRIEGAVNNGHWDTHTKNTEALRNWLMPRMDQAYTALLEDLRDRGLWDETLVVWTGEFGRTPKINQVAGLDHWGNVFSLALSGAGIKQGCIHGESDRLAAEPVAGMVRPEDVMATIFHTLGIPPTTMVTDRSGRTHQISRGRVIREVLA